MVSRLEEAARAKELAAQKERGWYWTEPYYNVTHYRREHGYRYWGTLSVHESFIDGYCYDSGTGMTYNSFTLYLRDFSDAEAMLHEARVRIERHVS